MTYRELLISILNCYEDIMDDKAEILINNKMCHISNCHLKSEAPELLICAKEFTHE